MKTKEMKRYSVTFKTERSKGKVEKKYYIIKATSQTAAKKAVSKEFSNWHPYAITVKPYRGW